MPQFLMSTGLDLATRPKSVNIFQQVATSAKGPLEKWMETRAAREGVDDKLSAALFGDVMDIETRKELQRKKLESEERQARIDAGGKDKKFEFEGIHTALDKLIKQQREYRNRKYKTDLNFKLKTLLYSRLHGALRRKKRSFTIMKLTGTTLDKVWEHLKKNFYLNPKTGEQMTRYNMGFYGWHIDHIKPCASFDLRCPIGQLDCFHYTNLRPLWAFDNLSKGSKILDLRNKS